MEMRNRNMKGILLTLLTIVLFVLMVTELIAYVVANINYGNLVAQSVFTASASAAAASMGASLSATLHSSVSSALSALTAFESNTAISNAVFINSSSYALSSLIMQGNVFGINMSSYIGGGNIGLLVTGQNELGTFAPSVAEKAALAHGINMSINNGTLEIYQTSPFAVNATFSGVIAVNASSQLMTTLPISYTGSANINGTLDLSTVEAGYPTTIKARSAYPSASLIGATFASYGSTGPYMFAYGPAIVIGGTPSCSNIPAAYQSSNYILVARSSVNIPSSLCGMAGLVTNTPNSIAPNAPYLVYNAPSIFNSIQNGTSVLLNGPSLGLYNVTGFTSALQNGYYYPSPYTSSYLQDIQGSTYQSSPYGMFSFAPFDRPVAVFNGANSVAIVQDQTVLDWPTNSLSFGAWIYLRQSATGAIITKDNSGNTAIGSYGLFQSGRHIGFTLYKSGSPTSLYSAENLSLNTWHQVFAVYNGSVMKLYIDNAQDTNTVTLAGPYTSATGEFTMGGYGNLGSPFNGMIADVQVYFSNLSGQQVSRLYQRGFEGIPLTANMVGWWPLAGSTSDYYSGLPQVQTYALPDNVIYSSAVGYSGDPTSERELGQSSQYASTYVGNALVTANAILLGLSNTVTLSVWTNIKPTATQQVVARDGQFSLQFDTESVDDVEGYVNIGGSWHFANALPAYGQWTNYVMTYNNFANTLTMYRNGVPGATISVSGQLTYGDGASCKILSFGNYCAGLANVIGGSISNVQIYNKSANATQVIQIYQEGMSGGPLPNMGNVGWWPLNNNTLDYSAKQNNGVATNVIYSQIPADATPDVVQGASNCANLDQCSNMSLQHLYLDTLPLSNANGGYSNETASFGLQRAGIPDVVNVTGINTIIYAKVGSYFGSSNPMSFSAWYYATSTSGGPILGLASSTASSGWNSPVLSASGLTVNGWIYTGSSSTAMTKAVNPGWHNIVVTYSPAASGTQTFYVDGVQVATNTGTYSGSGATDYWTTYVPGVAHSSGGGNFQGMFSDVQFYNITLSAGQVQSIYTNDTIPVNSANEVFRWGMSSGINNLLNQTQDSVQGVVAYFAKGTATTAVTTCTNANVLNSACGISIVPP